MKVGDILYIVSWSIGYGPSNDDWDEGEAEYREPSSIKLETWRVHTVRRPPRKRNPILGLWGTRKKHVFIRRFDHGYGVRMKTKIGRVVGFEFDKTRDRYNTKKFPLGERPDRYRPTKRGAFKAAAASIRKNHWYKFGENIHLYEKMRTRLIQQSNKF